MTINAGLRLVAGFFTLLSVVLGWYVSPYFFLFTAFVGLNLLQASVTGFCPAAILFRKLGVTSGCAFKCTRPACA